jgi:asparagine synthase (glutamine-hydrolysing)
MGVEEICAELRARLSNAVGRNQAEGLLLSGGLDSSILAALSPGVKALTVALEGAYTPDIAHGAIAATAVGLEHHQSTFSAEEAMATIPVVIKMLKTFDLALPNDIAIYFGLRLAEEYGIKSVMSGDGADELFAGYSYMQVLDNVSLDGYIRWLAKRMSFSSSTLSKGLGLEIKQPYLDGEFIAFALEVEPHWKRVTEEGRTWGKWILRKAFESYLPQQLIWREKAPIEYGSGTTELRKLLSNKVSDFEAKKRKYEIKFINKEHLFYYEVYREVVGEVPLAKEGEERCPCCGAAMPQPGHCPTCGAPGRIFTSFVDDEKSKA